MLLEVGALVGFDFDVVAVSGEFASFCGVGVVDGVWLEPRVRTTGVKRVGALGFGSENRLWKNDEI